VIRTLKTRLASIALVVSLSTSPAMANSQKDWATVSDIGAYSLAAIAIGLPLVKHDTNGALQVGGSIASAQIISLGLKSAFPELRPDGSDRKSFPSGHTAQSFAAAATIFNREGKGAGLPAFAVATLVGFARVKADKHHWYDVVAGAAIGAGSGFLITRSRPEHNLAVIPWGDSKGGGVTVGMRF
jgi:membrane-associated phospholipid phosphatase